MCSGYSQAYAIKSCNKYHWGKVLINNQSENLGSHKNKSRMTRQRLCIKHTQIKARRPKLN